MKTQTTTILGLLLLFAIALSAQGGSLDGSVRVGYIYLDEEGSEGVYDPSFNMYEGAAVSLERFSYRFDDGTRVFGNLHNFTMNNRNMTAGVTKSGLLGVTLHNDQYRRQYSFSGSEFTRRRQSYGNAWVQPLEWLRVFGGYGLTDKHGTAEHVFEQFGSVVMREYDYRNKYYHGGVVLSKDRSRLKAEYRGSSFTDNLDDMNGRESARIRVSAVTQLPRYRNILLRGGFQDYHWEAVDRMDTLRANTFWGGGQWFFYEGFNFRYSMIFDRARRTGDPAATDNITNAFYLGRVWQGLAGVTVGYRYSLNDDIYDELTANGYYVDGWMTPTPKWTFRAGFGIETEDISDGATLTGARDYSRHHASVRFKLPDGYIRAQWNGKEIEHDDIATSTDYNRIGSDLAYTLERYGEIQVSYNYLIGEYENIDGTFKFKEHIVSGDFFPIKYKQVQLGAGAVYMRSQDDLDVESFQIRFSGAYSFMDDHRFEVRYAAHNFDDLAAPRAPYTQYYTGNVVEFYVVRDF